MNNILIIKHGALGDVVRTSYFLGPLRAKFPNAKITWVTKSSGAELIQFHPEIEQIIVHDYVDTKGPTFDSIRGKHFDWVLSLDDEKDSYYFLSEITFTKLSGAYGEGDKTLYTDDFRPWFDMGLISRLGKERADALKIANARSHATIFATMLNVEMPKPILYRDASILSPPRDTSRRRIGLNLSAGKRWPSKTLDAQVAIEVISKLLSDECNDIFVLGGTDDLAFNEALLKSIPQSSRLQLVKPAKVHAFASFIASLDLLISSDSLALHLAIAQNVPTVSFFAPTSAVEIDIFGRGEKIASTSPDYCSYQPVVDTSTITATRLLSAIERVLL